MIDNSSFYTYDLNDPYEKIKINKSHYTQGAKSKPRPITNELWNKIAEEEAKEKEFDENLRNEINSKKLIEEESKDSIEEISKINDKIKHFENIVESNRLKINESKLKLSSIKKETKEDMEIRTKQQYDDYINAKKQYDLVKKENDECIIPDRIVQPDKNAGKSEWGKFTKAMNERERIKIKKNQLVITLRNREIDLQKAEEALKKAREEPTDKQDLEAKCKLYQKEYQNGISEITKLKTEMYKHSSLLAKLELCDEKIKKANDKKFAYKMRGMSVISKNGIINYDKNGRIIKENPTKKLFESELAELEKNPPMIESKSINYSVAIECDYLKQYYLDRYDLVNSYKKSNNLDEDTIEWIKNNQKELKEINKKIKELEDKYYNNDLWLEIDEKTYLNKKKEIYEKYDYSYNGNQNPKIFEKKYTINDFIKSIGK